MSQNPESNGVQADTHSLEPARRWSRPATAAVATLALAVVGGVIWYGTAKPARTTGDLNAGDAATQPAARVVVAPAWRGSLDVHLFALGTVTPHNVVVVRSRVDGQLVQVAFKEGQFVNQGDVIAQIDPRPFEVQLQLATGQRARNQALLESARADLERFRTLLAQDSISALQVDTQSSLVRQYEAALQADQGAVDNAKLQLAHATVEAPISGRVGLRQVDPGNVVRASDPNGIVVITQLQPIDVVFPIPEDNLPRVMKRLRAGDRIAVEVYDRAQKERLAGGWLLTADNQIDTATGTVKLKAEFGNTDGTLTANQFVNVKMAVETLADALLVPTPAIQRGPNGTFLYVVNNDRSVKATPVQVRATEGETSAVAGSIQPGASVVVDGADRLRDGAAVEVSEAANPSVPKRGAASAAPVGAPARKGGGA